MVWEKTTPHHLIARVNSFPHAANVFKYETGKVSVVKEKAYSTDGHAAIMHPEVRRTQWPHAIRRIVFRVLFRPGSVGNDKRTACQRKLSRCSSAYLRHGQQFHGRRGRSVALAAEHPMK
jgi:hypothetical protein